MAACGIGGGRDHPIARRGSLSLISSRSSLAMPPLHGWVTGRADQRPRPEPPVPPLDSVWRRSAPYRAQLLVSCARSGSCARSRRDHVRRRSPPSRPCPFAGPTGAPVPDPRCSSGHGGPLPAWGFPRSARSLCLPPSLSPRAPVDGRRLRRCQPGQQRSTRRQIPDHAGSS